MRLLLHIIYLTRIVYKTNCLSKPDHQYLLKILLNSFQLVLRTLWEGWMSFSFPAELFAAAWGGKGTQSVSDNQIFCKIIG